MGKQISQPKQEKNTKTGESPRMTFATSDMQGFRKEMQDSRLCNLLLDQRTAIFGVFDGHRGHEVSEFVSRHFTKELLKTPAYRDGRMPDALRDTFMVMDELLLTVEGQKELVRISKGLPDEYQVEVNEPILAGCTAIVALIRDNELFVANAGDSRCVLSSQGKAIDMSSDHKPDNIEENERILNAGGHVENGRVMGNLNLSRSIGDLDFKANRALPAHMQMIISMPDISFQHLTENDDFLILACDGIWDVFTSQQAVDLVNKKIKKKQLGIIAEEFLDNCLITGMKTKDSRGSDNMTVIIVAFKHPL